MIDAHIDDDGCLIVAVRSPLPAAVGGLGLLFIGWLAYEVFSHSHNYERMQGLAGAIFTCMTFLAVYERSDFRFDARRNRLSWSRRIGPFNSSDELALDQIQSVLMETAMGQSRYYPKHRLVLRTATGAIPIRRSYQRDDMQSVVLGQIRDYLRMPPDPGRTDTVLALIDAHRDVEAIKLLRETRGLSLTDAHTEVARIRAGRDASA
jgi:hypothetical protein